MRSTTSLINKSTTRVLKINSALTPHLRFSLVLYFISVLQSLLTKQLITIRNCFGLIIRETFEKRYISIFIYVITNYIQCVSSPWLGKSINSIKKRNHIKICGLILALNPRETTECLFPWASRAAFLNPLYSNFRKVLSNSYACSFANKNSWFIYFYFIKAFTNL